MSHSLSVDAAVLAAPQFTIATLVNDEEQYSEMRKSFSSGGFSSECTEYISIRDARSAFAGLNAALANAKGKFVILCHQDVRLLRDDRQTLAVALEQLTQKNPAWALAGNAGGICPGSLVLRITDPHGSDQHSGPLPARVVSLDENFIVVRSEAGVRFSRDLTGFHLYGADICLAADMMGWSAWVIDFHIEHLSRGRKDATFTAAEVAFREKWSRALRPRWMQTTCTLLHISGSTSTNWIRRWAERPVQGVLRRSAFLRRMLIAQPSR